MKNLITLLIVLLSTIGYSQNEYEIKRVKENYDWFLKNKKSVELEFVRLIDSSRQSSLKDVLYGALYGTITDEILSLDSTAHESFDIIFNTKKEAKEYLKVEKKKSDFVSSSMFKHKTDFGIGITRRMRPVHVEYSEGLSLAAEHHTKFQLEVEESGFLSHSEFKDYFGYEYNGDMEILESHTDRVNRYCSDLYAMGECISFDPQHRVGCTQDISELTIKEVAYKYFISFKNSKGHWDIFMREGNLALMGVSFGMSKTNYIVLTTLIGNYRNNKGI